MQVSYFLVHFVDINMLLSQNSVNQKVIILLGESFTYTHNVNTRLRSMRLAIHHDGRIIITTGKRVSDEVIQSFLKEKSLWIKDKVTYFKNNPKTSLTPKTNEEVFFYKKKALEIVKERLVHFNVYYNYVYGKVTIKDTKGRWGSCSSKGNLNFNYKIALLPPELADYVVVHELCHLKEMNHGEKFWTLVEKQIQHYKKLRTELKKYSL